MIGEKDDAEPINAVRFMSAKFPTESLLLQAQLVCNQLFAQGNATFNNRLYQEY